MKDIKDRGEKAIAFLKERNKGVRVKSGHFYTDMEVEIYDLESEECVETLKVVKIGESPSEARLRAVEEYITNYDDHD